MQRMIDAQKRERDQIAIQIREVKGLMPLLMKRRNGSRWSEDERAELLGQLRAIVNLSPYLVVLAVPGSFIAMPVLAWWLDRRRIRRNGTHSRGSLS